MIWHLYGALFLLTMARRMRLSPMLKLFSAKVKGNEKLSLILSLKSSRIVVALLNPKS
ncbi:hypothetical protein KP509_02G001300 [Ceratopteris richardii]|uniref:Uncharacterized protein n=1 Tax=Ceratopteris richardii TaxID=49495 RepID=A0A8T2V2W5_CERRI|nr:hypothetical protein KP509_02G001300 [Ceratopteris richardii]